MRAWDKVALSGALVFGLAGAMTGPEGLLIGGVAAVLLVLFVVFGKPIERQVRESETEIERVGAQAGAVVYAVVFVLLFTLAMAAVAVMGAGS